MDHADHRGGRFGGSDRLLPASGSIVYVVLSIVLVDYLLFDNERNNRIP